MEHLRLEGGNVLSPEVEKAGLQQVLLYWRKLKGIAEKVTEVKLTLPDCESPGGVHFGIEGVVDIVREETDGGGEHTTMYDLKTHDADYVRANPDDYAAQLNVYAHIWENLRGQALDETAIISTAIPVALRQADNEWSENVKDPRTIAVYEKALATWDPIVPIPFDASGVAATVTDFGKVVDGITSHYFEPPPVAVLKEKKVGQKRPFVSLVCINCDARFSCDSYRAYALGSGAAASRTFAAYFGEVQTDNSKDDWLVAGLDHNDQKDIEELL